MNPGVTTQPDASSSRVAAQVGADLADHTVGDRDVGDPARRAAAVDDGAAADDEVSASRVSLQVHEVARAGSTRRPGGRPAVDRQHDAGDLRGAVARQEEHRVGDVAGDPCRWSGCIALDDQRLVEVRVDRGGDVRRARCS